MVPMADIVLTRRLRLDCICASKTFGKRTTQNPEHAAAVAKAYGGGSGNQTLSHDELSLSMDEFNQEFLGSLDLETSSADSSPIELNDVKPPGVPVMETGASRKENDSNLDLKLSPPGVVLTGRSSNESKFSSPASQGSCVSVEVNSQNKPPPVDESALIVMGCTRCLLYVMVSDANPRCPKCRNSGLLDIFRGNQAKRSREN